MRRATSVALCVTLFVAFATMPSGVPVATRVAGFGFYLYEPLLVLLALLVLGLAPREARLTVWALAIMAVWVAVVGRLNGNDPDQLLAEARNALDLALAAAVAAAAHAAGYRDSTLKMLKFTLWWSAVLSVASSLGLLELQGQAARAAVGQDVAGDATRVLSAATFPAVITVCCVIALLATGRLRGSAALPYLLPAVLIMILAFSRNHLLAIGVALLAAFLVERSSRTLVRIAVGGVVVAFFLTALVPVVAANGGGYVATQIDGFQERVLNQLSGSARARDESALYRAEETRALIERIPEAPLMGQGFGADYKPATGAPGTFTATTGRYYAHQYYLWLWFKGGLVALALFALAIFTPIARAVRRPRTSDTVALTAAVAAQLAISVVAPIPNGVPTAVLFGVVIGALASAASAAGPLRVGSRRNLR